MKFYIYKTYFITAIQVYSLVRQMSPLCGSGAVKLLVKGGITLKVMGSKGGWRERRGEGGKRERTNMKVQVKFSETM